MTQYAAEIKSAAKDIQAAGAPVIFDRPASGYDSATGQFSGAAVTASGYAIVVKGNPTRFLALGLVLNQPITLLASAEPLGSFVPTPGDQMTYAGAKYTVKDVDPTAPDGTPILFRITGSL